MGINGTFAFRDRQNHGSDYYKMDKRSVILHVIDNLVAEENLDSLMEKVLQAVPKDKKHNCNNLMLQYEAAKSNKD